MTMAAWLKIVKSNLILDHNEDDALIKRYIAAAIAYAERYQHKADEYYSEKDAKMHPFTEQAVIMLASHFYESRDGSGGGFFPDKAYAGTGQQSIDTVHKLLRMDKDVIL